VGLIGDIRHMLLAALDEENRTNGLSQKTISDRLSKHKSWISKILSGRGNMTLETLSDIAYAMNRTIKIELVSRTRRTGTNEPPKVEVRRSVPTENQPPNFFSDPIITSGVA